MSRKDSPKSVLITEGRNDILYAIRNPRTAPTTRKAPVGVCHDIHSIALLLIEPQLRGGSFNKTSLAQARATWKANEPSGSTSTIPWKNPQPERCLGFAIFLGQ
jgi:hypothetical protein